MSILGNRALALVITVLVAVSTVLVPSANAADTGTISGTVTVASTGSTTRIHTQAQVLTVPANGNTTGIAVTLSTEALPVPAPSPTPTPTPVATSVTASGGPRISGIPRVGQRVRAKIGTVTPTSAKVRYVWAIDGRRIKKATSRSLQLKAPMKGHILSLRVIASAPGLTPFTGQARSKFVRPAR